ncbi:ISAs1 family transposase [Oceanisphaera profunda]|uniref:ISAs1 family transposase n=1 Tax=Oceanisphaera profunda TaxID=1416627 RepID=A0A1Y0D9I7_9GAMM|nr:ISAs1 family transposase [Oceanisphaera profunda]ART82247.1 ISAs1 family transposase [Oceanisphaera profunda]ART83661.1 ISAs1 family transposase [Oceanisphaera profunda]ART83856.1 ISAs1 family transposase [Oceanisphaera profunda]ART83857.1 ISAs1 family transposase [Oceanisphaera profunda]
MNTDAFTQYFGEIDDPRQPAKIIYPLFDVLFLTICAVIAGAEGWEDIEDFGSAHLNWFQKKGLFPEGVPVHDTIARVISRLDPVQFQQCFIRWVQSITHRTDGELIAIDGKVLRGSYDRENRQSTIHMVSAFSSANGVVMGQLKTNAKSNEITAIPALLKLLDIKGCLISIDAMGCQTNIAKTIINQGGDYLLAVKGNQELLFKAVRTALSASIAVSTNSDKINIEQGHGRTEIREYHVLPAGDLAHQFPDWKGLKTIGVAIGYRREKSGKSSLEYRYYISSAELDSIRFGKAVRGHWGIENSLHWVLDVSMKEDACPIYRENGAEVLASIRHLALNMIRSETSRKASVRRKQKMASMSCAYLDKILVAGFTVLGKK